ncbi:thiamine pyrophosphate-binding protein [Sorangium sp. So ce136]|uniref:thiamine pyrophosphate-binding protein n=1 Tax=Sorangium sp. So ce136 TaxID=3133284 RepID=UPI003F061202
MARTQQRRTGRHAVIEQLRADGIEYIFGNPGTVEQGLLDALTDYEAPRYVLALQETVAVAMADGYARAGRRPAVVQVHSSVGLGNSIGMLYQAKRGHAPLVVLAGEAGLRYDAMEAQMAADLTAMAAPVTKWSTRVVHPESLLRVIRRAIKTALTPPMGPVFVSLPMDILDAVNEESVVPTSVPITRVVPEPALVARAAAMLAGASRPMFIVGDGVAASGAQAELTRLAEQVGAEVWGADYGDVNMSATHPLFQGLLGHMFGEQSRAITTKADVLLLCGTYVFPEVFPALSGVFAPGAQVIHVDLDPQAIARSFPVDLGLLADPKGTLRGLAAALASIMTPAQRDAARDRAARLGEARDRERDAAIAADRAARGATPMRPSQLMEELAAALPEDAMIFDEAITCSPELWRYRPPVNPGDTLLTRGGSLGVGFPGALGMKLACPERTVVGVSGDGGTMYTPQALWTAARDRIDVKMVVCNNGSYEILKQNLEVYWQERGLPARAFPPSYDLACPDIHFDELARSMGVPAARVERPEQVGPAIQQALGTPGPFLVDVVIAGDARWREAGACGE